jgi:hypothetical protein
MLQYLDGQTLLGRDLYKNMVKICGPSPRE